MVCPKCGSEIPEGVKFCTTCGTPVAAQAAPEPVQPAPAPAPVPTPAPVNVNVTNNTQIPDKYKPIGAWGYFGINILFSIPVVGIIFLIVWACGGTGNINKRNYARSFFCGLLVCAVIILILFIILLIVGGMDSVKGAFDSFLSNLRR